MDDPTQKQPTRAERVARRLAQPGTTPGGSVLESGGAAADVSEARIDDSLRKTAERMRELAAGDPTADVGDDTIGRVLHDAESGLRKLNGEGLSAEITPEEEMALEAVIIADGTRPVLFVQDGTVDLTSDRLGSWQGALQHFLPQVERIAAATCRIDCDALSTKYAGTGWVIAPGLVATNRHVLETIAVPDGAGGWSFPNAVRVDFGHEFERDRAVVFDVTGVALTGPDPINWAMDFAKLDLAVLRCQQSNAAADAFPEPVSLEADIGAYDAGRDLYTIGFPARPRAFFDVSVTPPASHEHVTVINQLFLDRFGFKRWAPGKLIDPPGSLGGDVQGWVINHDITTLGGNSGSLVVDFSAQGERVMALHFGGVNRDENFAHVAARMRESLQPVDPVFV
jgi:Trypsin-like peptidase domain